jgi:hypothetical protein
MAIRLTQNAWTTSPLDPKSETGRVTVTIDRARDSDRDANRLAAAVADLSDELARAG